MSDNNPTQESIKEAAQALDESIEITNKELSETLKQASQSIDVDIEAVKEGLAVALQQAGKSLATIFTEANIFASIGKYFTAASEAFTERLKQIQEHIESYDIELSYGAFEKVAELEPYLLAELEAAAKDNPEFADCNIFQLLEGFTEDGEPKPDSPYKEIIERAFAAQAAAEGATKQLEAAAKVTAKPTDKISYPIDKVNSNIWNLLATAITDAGQLRIDIDTRKKGSKKDAIIMYGIDFANLDPNVKITAKLTAFDKRVYIAAASLFNGENEIMTATQIYRQMGNTGRPRISDVKKINDSLTKMGAARVYLNNEQETAVNKKYPRFKYDAPLLPFERMTAIINGKETDSAIHLLREPPLITFARQREQITTIKRELLESPINKTDANLLLDDYLIERISRMKNGKGKSANKMLYSTIYKQCNITTKNQRTRAPEKIKRYLEHYKSCNFIKGYTEDKDGITITL